MILFEAWWKLLAADLLLRTRPFPGVERLVSRRFRAGVAGDPQQDLNTIAHLQPLVATASHHHLYPMTCLRQALALQDMLGRRGLHAQLRIGVRKEEGNLQAHAWLEFQGQTIEVERPRDEHLAAFIPMEIPR